MTLYNDCKRYDLYHRRFPRYAMQFQKFNAMFGSNLPKLPHENSIRVKYSHNLKLGKANLGEHIDIASNTTALETVRNPVVSTTIQATSEKKTNTCPEESETSIKPQLASTASLFFNEKIPAYIKRDGVCDKPSFAGVFKKWASKQSRLAIQQRAYLCKTPPMRVNLNDIESVNRFIDSISFSLDQDYNTQIAFINGDTFASDQLTVRIDRTALSFNSSEVQRYMSSKKAKQQIVWL